ncbi:DUF3592 domain-containing protein [Amycolatopsis sp. DG1A-15b]|uniref:DUF3592 domain-containing protein n=1 Tax=Amycolatopsis sp. DG1A-15b TaxID=3052846 RepID=UPI00255B838B|nr:DUF3592 domain-containing protein [Amycolatopsis sp. DG1A-15b]WIX91373.1 DUF3592 domain-containing protein [Amycolatopsis sp. DG1A-15b]
MFGAFDLGLPGDPRPARRAGRRLWLLGVPTTLAWAAVGWSGALGLLDGFRLMSLNRVDAWGADAGPVVSLVLFFSVAITVASSLGFAMLWGDGLSLSRLGVGLRASSLAAALGVALGTGVAIPSWSPPESVGQRLPSQADGKSTPWSDVDWVVYYEPYLLPAVSALVALVVIVVLLRAFLAAAEADDRVESLRRGGRQVTGHVTHVEFTSVWIMGHPRFVVHVRFPTESGERTVVTTMVTPLFQAPARGSTVLVRYDPRDPDEVLVEPDPAAAFPGPPFDWGVSDE